MRLLQLREEEATYDPTDRLLMFGRLLSEHSFTSVYQPIWDLQSGVPIGHEALSRFSVAHPQFQEIQALFRYAEEMKLLPQLENITWRNALRDAPAKNRLFLNCSVETMLQPDGAMKMIGICEQAEVEMDRIVLEVTERSSVRDWMRLKKVLSHFRGRGMQIAMDDVSSGCSTLESIYELRPDFIKIDGFVVRGIHLNDLKRAMFEALVSVSEKADATVIAEGVEVQQELEAVRRAGVRFVQGNFLGEPIAKTGYFV